MFTYFFYQTLQLKPSTVQWLQQYTDLIPINESMLVLIVPLQIKPNRIQELLFTSLLVSFSLFSLDLRLEPLGLMWLAALAKKALLTSHSGSLGCRADNTGLMLRSVVVSLTTRRGWRQSKHSKIIRFLESRNLLLHNISLWHFRDIQLLFFKMNTYFPSATKPNARHRFGL